MVRIFNIYFTYKDVTHSAIVSVHQTETYTEFTLKNFDASLLDVLPGIKIISGSSKDLKFADAPLNPTPVMQEILDAVSSHMEIIGT
jgi:hypothetical protein